MHIDMSACRVRMQPYIPTVMYRVACSLCASGASRDRSEKEGREGSADQGITRPDRAPSCAVSHRILLRREPHTCSDIDLCGGMRSVRRQQLLQTAPSAPSADLKGCL